mmetsp:Transcript_24012/g.37662  ORF Transcript_24012/g.37662 Transcript_24012/m.37662 type:complete len:81 (+) Transcript_24012:1432-1674(+)
MQLKLMLDSRVHDSKLLINQSTFNSLQLKSNAVSEQGSMSLRVSQVSPSMQHEPKSNLFKEERWLSAKAKEAHPSALPRL